jgi:hypothetical protein
MADYPISQESSQRSQDERRGAYRNKNYYRGNGLAGAERDEVQRTDLDALGQQLRRFGFKTIFAAAEAAAKVGDPAELNDFVVSGGFGRIYGSFTERRRQRARSPSVDVQQLICQPAVDIYMREWRDLMKESTTFKHPLNKFSPEYATEFNIDKLYRRMADVAPCFVGLLCSLTPERSSATDSSGKGQDEAAPAQHRYIATAISIIANYRSREFNVMQGRIGYYLFACRVPKRVISTLNKLGLCPSYSGLLVAIKATAEAALVDLRQVALNNQAVQISYDNLSYSANKRDLRLHNYAGIVIHTAGYTLIPADSQARPTFGRSALTYHRIDEVNLTDIMPDIDAAKAILAGTKHMISKALFAFAKGQNQDLRIPITFEFPARRRLDRHATPKILTLPTYPLNEGIISELTEVICRVADDLDMTVEQRETTTWHFKGDLKSVLGNRYACKLGESLILSQVVFRSSNNSFGKRLDFVESSAGLFHLRIHALSVVFNNHYGDNDTPTSLASWIKYLGRDNRKMWNEKQALVKQYHACCDLVDNLLSGYIIAWLTCRSELTSVPELARRLGSLSPNPDSPDSDLLFAVVGELGDIMTDYFLVPSLRRSDDDERDRTYENAILFMQQAMVVRIFLHACRIGDTGVVVDCISVFAVWFQATGKYNYARETIHMKACLSKLWSAEFRDFWLDFCLINPSGKKEGWMPCDYFGEYVVREVKAMMHNDTGEVHDRFLRETLSPLIMNFREIRQVMEVQCGVPFSSQHSTPVDSSADVAAIAIRLIAEGVFRWESGRDGPTCKDLFLDGQTALAGMKPMLKYIGHIKRRLWQTDSTLELEEETDQALSDEDNPAEEDSESDDDLDVGDVLSDEGDDWLNEAVGQEDT